MNDSEGQGPERRRKWLIQRTLSSAELVARSRQFTAFPGQA
jgi:hypothetical protein